MLQLDHELLHHGLKWPFRQNRKLPLSRWKATPRERVINPGSSPLSELFESERTTSGFASSYPYAGAQV